MRRTPGSRVALLVIGSMLALVGFAFVLGGGALVWAHTTQRDSDGWYTTSTERLDTSTYALVAEADFGTEPGAPGWFPDRPVGTVRIEAAAPDGALFVGIARTAAVDRWLGDVARERVRELRYGPFHTESTLLAGGAPDGTPGAQDFWVARSEGPGQQSVRWESEPGRWTAVVMNADGSRNVAADLAVGARTWILLPIGLGLGVAGLALLAGGVALSLVGARRDVDAPKVPDTPRVLVAGAYPVRLDARIDEPLSRWLWLVKWLLVLPHVVVLAFLWLAALGLTVVAGFGILLTGRYPQAIFDFNVGVLRWTWRVSYYAIGAFGSDRYPPFRLDADPDYPADFDVDRPERLSRGLVLVKWWLLAIPHYLVVAALAGGWGFGGDDGWRIAGGGGLIAILALVAAVMLTVRGRYPQELFDLVLGFNRWVFRVLAYALLLRDEYPPFRLDTGGVDPGSRPVPVEPSPAAPGTEVR